MSKTDVTQILRLIVSGVPQASDQLLPLVYNELRQLAAVRLRNEKAGHTLQATALVHEAYLRLMANDQQPSWDSRHHFFAAAAEAMRRILIENARRKKAGKRGGGWLRNLIEPGAIQSSEPDIDLVALDDALERLGVEDPQAALLVKLRYFTGLTIPQAAEVLDVSTRTAERLWTYAKAWLFKELSDS